MRAAVLLALPALAVAKDIIITVGGDDPANVFSPQRVTAGLGDTVIFNFTSGNHSATQSTFAQPCVPAHLADPTLNGFDSLPRLAGNGTNISILPVPILPQNAKTVFWFFDAATCGQGGVGAINNDEGGNQTLDGFVRNAERLNGSAASSSAGAGPSSTASASGTGASASPTSAAEQVVVRAAAVAAPLAALALALAL